MSENFQMPKPPAQEIEPVSGDKISEYIERAKAGESVDSFGDIPESWRAAIDDGLSVEQNFENDEDITPEMVSENQSGHEQNEIEVFDLVSVEDRQGLLDWPASYELAKIAHNNGIDLSKLSREQYVDYAIANDLRINDAQLRTASWERTGTSPAEIIEHRKKVREAIPEKTRKEFDIFCFRMKELAGKGDRSFQEDLRVRQGTKDSDSWLYFGINENIHKNKSETHKGYLTLENLNNFSPKQFVLFMEALRDAGYNGGVKIFQDLEAQGAILNDQIVMHGSTYEDVTIANNVADQFFGDELAEIGRGKDEIINGKSKSYSQILSDKIQQEVNQKAV